VCAPVIDEPPAIAFYEQGSWGPQDAIELPGLRGWRLPDDD
jgi:glucose-6-phosphate 1-dehydrogenase